jgi:hypothetical protein
MASTLKWTAYNTPDTAVAGATMNALTNTSFAYGSEIDNSSGLYLYGDLVLSLAASLTAVAPAYLLVYLIPNIDTNYVASSGNPGSSYVIGTGSYTAGTLQFMQVRGLILTPNKFKIVIQNNLGATFSASNSHVCSLYRYSEQLV